MSQPEKIRVAVLYGGRSGEHEVSLVSATNVIQNLDRHLFDVIPIGIDKQGGWFLGDDIIKKELTAPRVLKLQRETSRELFNPDLIGKAVQRVESSELSLRANESGRLFDVIFPVIHGTFCEDGTVQGLLELADLPYVGCGVLASAVGMDKDVSKRLVQNAGIAVAPFVTIKRGEWDRNSKAYSELVNKQLRYPLFVKPSNAGSSVGIEKVKSPELLSDAINKAFHYDTKVVVEEGIDAIEIEVAVLESAEYGLDPIVSVPGEVRPAKHHEFYSYASKYLDENGAELIIPAALSDALSKKIQKIAKEIFHALDCEGMARVDLFLERGTNKIYFNEINTLPGFTEVSMFPKLMGATGIQYSDLLTHLIRLAMARSLRKSKLSREWVSSEARL